MFSIGPHTLKSRVLLAPMAGITDLPFRDLCNEFGAGLVTSEMVTSDISLWKSKKSQSRLSQPTQKRDYLNSIQIAGNSPDMMAQAAQECEKLGADIIDINMGCPAKKVCKKLAGSALLQDTPLVEKILHKVVNAVSIPVTLKTRTGWNKDNQNGIEVAKIAEQAGIQSLAVHGRTRACRFNGSAEYDNIAHIVDSISIPVIANGDIDSAQKALQVLQQTCAAGIMIGRSALGQPWLFRQINDFLKHKNSCKITSFSLETQIYTIIKHINALHTFYGEQQGVKIARKHIGWYVDNLKFHCHCFEMRKNFKKTFNAANCPKLQFSLIHHFFNQLVKHEEKVA